MNERGKVGLALGGGVARGMAHLGVLETLLEAGIPIDAVAGTSAGSLVGAAFCAGLPLSKIHDFARALTWRRIARPVWPRRGLVSFDPLARLIAVHFGDRDISNLPLPFIAVAVDLHTGEPVYLRRGPLAPALCASCAVPGFVEPLEIDGRLLGDGSITDTIPVAALRCDGAAFIIAVDLFVQSIRPRWGAFGMGFTALEILVRRAGGGIGQADCLITPNLAGLSYLRMSLREKLYLAGRQAALAKLPEIRRALEMDEPERNTPLIGRPTL